MHWPLISPVPQLWLIVVHAIVVTQYLMIILCIRSNVYVITYSEINTTINTTIISKEKKNVIQYLNQYNSDSEGAALLAGAHTITNINI